MESEKFKKQLGIRIRNLREKFDLSQIELAERVGWGSQHVIVGNVESGDREVKAWELLRLSDVFKIDVNSLIGSGPADYAGSEASPAYVLWRQKPDLKVRTEQEAKFFEVIRRYDFLEKANELSVRKKVRRNFPTFNLDLSSTDFESVSSLAETCRNELGLGLFPAKNLISVLEDEYQVKMIYLNTSHGSAACTRSADGASIMLNVNEVPWRRNFSIAHELFHIVTWNRELFEQVGDNHNLTEKNEKLANAFAASLLMPSEQTLQLINQYRNSEGKIAFADLIAIAREFEVSTDALVWRLVRLRIIDSSIARDLLKNAELKESEAASIAERKRQDHFRSWRFVRLAYQAHARGRLSRGQFAKYLGVSLVDLDNELAEFGLVEADGPEIEISNT